jgi:hypothetical protein
MVNKFYIYIYILVGVLFLKISYHGLITIAPNKILQLKQNMTLPSGKDTTTLFQ